jgi:hypothetical protein
MKISSSLLFRNLFIIDAASAFIVSSPTTTTKCAVWTAPATHGPSSIRVVERDEDGNIRKGPLEFLLDPKPTKIPLELKHAVMFCQTILELCSLPLEYFGLLTTECNTRIIPRTLQLHRFTFSDAIYTHDLRSTVTPFSSIHTT